MIRLDFFKPDFEAMARLLVRRNANGGEVCILISPWYLSTGLKSQFWLAFFRGLEGSAAKA